MNIFIYSDESGVFDKTHNDIFVFGGLIILGQESKEIWSRKYSAVEKAIRKKISCPTKQELKACKLRNKEKNKLYRSLNNCYKFGVVIKQKDIMDRIFVSKKDKQRYLDYAFKIAIKKALAKMIQDGIIKSEEVDNIHFYVDEHTTATNGRYELREGLEQELKNGVCQDSCHNSFKFFKTMKHPQYSLLYPQLCPQFYPQFFLFSLDLKTPYPLMTNF